jgi:hypothetical protein
MWSTLILNEEGLLLLQPFWVSEKSREISAAAVSAILEQSMTFPF